MSLELAYIYGNEAEQYSFYRIPKVLLTDHRYRSVSMEAKVLYGLMLDRMALSVRNGWLDSEGRVYIYFTQEDAMALMSCGKDKATRLFRELDQNGIGLIERQKQGQGRPARIYVKNFTLPPDTDQPQPEQTTPPCVPKTASFEQSGPLEMRGQDSAFSAHNKTEKNKTDTSHTESSISPPTPSLPAPAASGRPKGKIRMDEMDRCRERIKENIDFDILLDEHPYDAETLEGYVELMVEVCCTRRETVRINQEDLPTAVVRNRFLKLNQEHILYVMEAMRKNTTQVANIRAYTLSALYNAPVTIGQYYAAQVSHDMAQGWRAGT